MYVIVKEKTNNHVILVWECDIFELTDSHLMVQGEGGMQIFNEYNNVDYIAEYYDGDLMEGFDPTMYSFESGQFTQIP